MSLTVALNNSFAGIQNTQSKIQVVSQNVTNADKPGYSKKVFDTNFGASVGGSVPVGGSIQSSQLNEFLLEDLVFARSNSAYDAVVADYLESYVERLGNIDGTNSISNGIAELATSFDILSLTPDDNALKAKVVNDANNLSSRIRNTSDIIQDQRFQADQAIEQTVDTINELVASIDELNEEIAIISSSGKSAADLQDEQRFALQELSALINVDYFFDDTNRLNIYTSGGQPLLTGEQRLISYEASGAIAPSVTTFQPISLNGVDITTEVRSGQLAGLIELRDEILVNEQEKLDELSDVLITEMNQLLNTGSSIPPRTDYVGDTRNLAGTDALTVVTDGVGDAFFRVSVVDNDGFLLAVADIDLNAVADIDDLITEINNLNADPAFVAVGATITANLDADGALQITSGTADQGLAFAQLPEDTGLQNAIGETESVSEFFGLNNLFFGSSSEDIRVSDYLLESADFLATAQTNTDALATLTTGDPALVADVDSAVFIGDGALAKLMNDEMTADQTFDPAGDFATQTNSISAYSDKIISSAANMAENRINTADVSTLVTEQLSDTLVNIEGVNVDEELTILIDLEAKYQASAQVVSTIQTLLQELINAVRS